MVKFECNVSGVTLINGFKVVHGNTMECNNSFHNPMVVMGCNDYKSVMILGWNHWWNLGVI
jgi:hypothetical protein